MNARNLIALALRRAGAEDLRDFQRKRGLYPSGQADILTTEQLMPYFTGYRRYRIRQGDSYTSIARQLSTTVGAITTANPNTDPRRLRPGQSIIVPLSFPVVPTDIPFTSELLGLCVEGLTMRYPFLSSRRLTVTAYGRPVTLLKIGEGRRSVLYKVGS